MRCGCGSPSCAHAYYDEKFTQVEAEQLHQFERAVMLQTLDNYWREHLAALDHLRQGIHLRGYAQKNPKQEYKREAFELFSTMLDSIRNEVTRILMTVQIQSRQDVEKVEEPVELQNVRYQHADYEEALAEEANAESEPRQGPAVRAPGPEGRTQRSLPVRLRQEVQAVPRPAGAERRHRRTR